MKGSSLLKILIVFLLTLEFISCRVAPELLITQRSELEVASASGIAVNGGSIFIIGDDVPWLYVLNPDFTIDLNIPYGDYLLQPDSVIAKADKPDLEALAASEAYGLLAFGSGSLQPQRDVLMEFTPGGIQKPAVHSLQKLYQNLRDLPELNNTPFNIEGAVIYQKKLYLLNRENNMLLELNLDEVMQLIKGKQAQFKLTTYQIQLPEINGIEAGLSGADIIPGSDILLFTASVEDRPNPVDDGKILGSFLGIIELDKLKNNYHPVTVPIADSSGSLKIKAESVAVVRHDNSITNLLLVTDSDGGKSQIIKAKFIW